MQLLARRISQDVSVDLNYHFSRKPFEPELEEKIRWAVKLQAYNPSSQAEAGGALSLKSQNVYVVGRGGLCHFSNSSRRLTKVTRSGTNQLKYLSTA